MENHTALYHPELELLAKEVITHLRWVSISLLQRRLHIGFGKAAAILQALEGQDLIGPADVRGQHQVLRDGADSAILRSAITHSQERSEKGMQVQEAFDAVQRLAAALPWLFQGADIELAFDKGGRRALGDRTDPDNPGFLVTGDGIGTRSGIYFFTCSQGRIIYIGKATKNNLHHRVWHHVKTPEFDSDGNWTFPKHIFRGEPEAEKYEAEILNGKAGLGVVTFSDPELVSMAEVYLHTVHQKQYGRLPMFNKQIG